MYLSRYHYTIIYYRKARNYFTIGLYYLLYCNMKYHFSDERRIEMDYVCGKIFIHCISHYISILW